MDGGKKYKIKDLPHRLDRDLWRQVFVPTFMTHVACQDNPFENHVTTGLAAMQKIWNHLFTKVPYKIVQNSPIYQLVCHNILFISLYTLKTFMLQTLQHVSDSWRSTISSTTITVVLAYCKANVDLKDSDELHQEFAKYYLQDLCFLYHKAEGDDPKVRIIR